MVWGGLRSINRSRLTGLRERLSYGLTLSKSGENPKRQSTAALQNLSDSRASPKLREVLECGCALPLWIEIPHHAKTVQPSPCECATKLNRTLEELIPTCHLRSATANLYYAWRRHSK